MTPEQAAQIVKRSIGIRQAERVADFQRIMRQNALVRRLVRKTQDGTLGRRTDDPIDDDMIQVGDNNITVYNDQKPGGKAGTLAKWALIAAGLAGAGGGAAYFASKLPALTDTDTKYELRLVDDAQLGDAPISVPADQ